ncbi:MAG TPA: UDP-N-acetylmuramate dehydrogenase, partial [Anaerolineales bacterium]|nr:UDP-N-acetylmuramate dehydrogenase [Anaerolineales bacterium]
AGAIHFEAVAADTRLTAESGASLGGVARRSAERGLSGLEWAATIPGTIGGAVVGNAGAHGGDMASSLESVEILQPPDTRETWATERLGYTYRSSLLKRQAARSVVLSASFLLRLSTPEVTKARIEANIQARRRTQPPGASLGSMFKNPPGDFAGRLVEAAGLKGRRRGAAEISPLHANFFINHGGARARDVADLLVEARRRVQETSGVVLEPEVELMGDWPVDIQEAWL